MNCDNAVKSSAANENDKKTIKSEKSIVRALTWRKNNAIRLPFILKALLQMTSEPEKLI